MLKIVEFFLRISSQGWRGRLPNCSCLIFRVLNGGRYYWEINVSQRIFGTSMMFGIGTRRARLHVDAFVNMLGEEELVAQLDYSIVYSI